jgi:aminoglycoside/choline kinase family phosphotransferase
MSDNNKTEILKDLAQGFAGAETTSCIPLITGSASYRKYYRLVSGDRSFIGTINKNIRENEAFFYLSAHFMQHGLPVPGLLAVDETGECYMQEDLGDLSLFDLLSGGYATEHQHLLRKALEWLVQFQVKGAYGLDYSRCYPNPVFDRQTALWDLHYFKFMFLKLSGAAYDDDRLENDFELLLDAIFDECPSGFMYRDFQSRNIMVKHNGLWFIDYQGGRRGPLAYDVASLLYQSRIDLPEAVREELTGDYCRMLQEYLDVEAAHFSQQVKGFAILRLLQTLGAYGYRGIFENKEAFRKPLVPAMLNTLNAITLHSDRVRLDYLQSLIQQLLPQFQKDTTAAPGLTIGINSFSYMHGIPGDDSGNGGGFMFDCRALPNPHRDEKLRPFTGKDKPIRDWFSEKPEVDTFLNHCEALVRASVREYLDRGFTNLQVNFGCTGGRHRSVYCAEVLYERLKSSGDELMLVMKHRNLE